MLSANDRSRFRQACHLVVEDRRNDRVQVGGLAQADFAGQIRSTAFKGGGELLEDGEVLEAIMIGVDLQSPSPRCLYGAVISTAGL